MTDIWTVSLELPECEGATPVDAVRDFQHQAEQLNLWNYRVRNDSTGEDYYVDMADETITEASES